MKSALNIILFVHVIDQVGGAEVAIRRLGERLVARGHNVTLVGSQPLSQWIRSRKLIEHNQRLRIIRFPIWQKSQNIIHFLMTLEMTIILLFLRHNELLHLKGINLDTKRIASIAQFLGIRTLCVPMGSGQSGDIAAYPSHIISKTVPYNWISCMTEDMKREVIEWGYPNQCVSVIPNGVDSDYFHPGNNLTNNHSVIFVGRFRAEKRIEIILSAWKDIQQNYQNATLSFIGDTDQYLHYQNLARQMGVDASFSPTLSADEILSHLQKNRIIVLASVSEGMSNALLEAMSTGLVPVVSDIPGNRAVVTPGVNGLTYEGESAEALAGALRQLFENPELTRQLGKAARETIVQSYSLESVVDRYESLYRKLLNAD